MLRLAATPFDSQRLLPCGKPLTAPFFTDTVSPPMADPHSLPLPMDLQEAQLGFWSNTLSKDTIQGYLSKKAKWTEFCTQFRRSPLDLSPNNIIDYATYLATRGKKGESPLAYSTIKAYLDFLGRATSYTSPQAPNPVAHPEVELFLRGIARVLGKKVEKATPCSLDHLRMLNSWAIQHPTNAETQTTAFLATLAFWGCLRLGSLIPKRPEKALQIVRLQDLELRGTSLIVTIRHSKTIRFSERQHVIEVPAQSETLLCPLRAFTRWISASPPQSSLTPLCALSTTRTTQLSHSRFLTLINNILQLPTPLTGHSFRRGFVRLAFSRGVPIWQVMHHGDWKTLEVAMSYAEDALIPNPLGGLSSLSQ
jgi:hypothetical protein